MWGVVTWQISKFVMWREMSQLSISVEAFHRKTCLACWDKNSHLAVKQWIDIYFFFLRCQCKNLRAQTCDVSLASLSGSTTTSITHDCACGLALMWAIPGPLWKGSGIGGGGGGCGGVLGSRDSARNPSSLKRYPSSHSAVRAAVWKYVSVKQQQEGLPLCGGDRVLSASLPLPRVCIGKTAIAPHVYLTCF